MVTTAGRSGVLLERTEDKVNSPPDHSGGDDDIGPGKGRATVPINGPLLTAFTEPQQASPSPYVIEWASGEVGSIKTASTQLFAAPKPDIARTTTYVERLDVSWPKIGCRSKKLQRIAGIPTQYRPFDLCQIFSRMPEYLRHAAGSST